MYILYVLSPKKSEILDENNLLKFNMIGYAIYSKFATLGGFEKKTLSKKTTNFSKKNFELFELSKYFSRFLWQIY